MIELKEEINCPFYRDHNVMGQPNISAVVLIIDTKMEVHQEKPDRFCVALTPSKAKEIAKQLAKHAEIADTRLKEQQAKDAANVGKQL